MNKLRTAVIGIGRAGWKFSKTHGASHISCYLNNPRTELVAVTDTDLRKLEDFKIDHPNIAVFQDYEKLMNVAKPEIVSICTPTETHCRVARNCARFASTKIIFCEKPLASTIEDAERMIRTCEQFQTKLACNMTRRWDPAYRRIKRVIDGEDENWGIGELLAFEGRFSGDVVNDGVHVADLGLWLANGDKSKIHLLNVPSPYLVFEADLWGEGGLIRVIHNGKEFQFWAVEESRRYSGFRELDAMITLGETYDFPRAMLNAVDDLVECASSGKQPDCTGIDGLNALKLALEKQGG